MVLPLTDSEITEKIMEHGIRPSLQRIQIYDFLCRNPIHPTAEAVFTALSPSIPTLSRTTVYNTLKLFCEQKLVQMLTIETDELRFDADTSEHLHFKCNCCGEIYDLMYEDTEAVYSAFKAQLPEGFRTEKIHTFLWGICRDCHGA